jgi:hypothetical protein
MQYIGQCFDLAIKIMKIKFDLFGIPVSFWNIMWFFVIAVFVIWILKEMFSN